MKPFNLLLVLLTAILSVHVMDSAKAQQNGSGAGAGRRDMSPEAAIQNMDQDGDGRISKKEFRGPRQRFPKLDTDGDGFITAEEFAASMGGGRGGAAQMQGGNGGAALARDNSQNTADAAWYAGLPIILTHTHFGNYTDASDWMQAGIKTIKEMDEKGIRASILMPQPSGGRTGFNTSIVDQLIKISDRYPGRFKVMGGGLELEKMLVNIKPGDVDDDDRAEFAKYAKKIIAKNCIGFGETAALHFAFHAGHDFKEVQPDHPLYLLLADLAAEYDVPLDIHMEVVETEWTVSENFHKRSKKNPEKVAENITAFERLLAHNPKARIVWVHLGMDATDQRSPALTRRLLQTHPNLFISITGSQNAKKYKLISDHDQLNPEWKDVIMAFPDRFTIGADTFFQVENPKKQSPQNITPASKILRLPLLPPDVARKLAFENAQRILKIDLIDPQEYPLPASTNP